MLSLLVQMQSGKYDYHTGGQTKFESLINLESSGYKRAEYKVKKSDNGKASIQTNTTMDFKDSKKHKYKKTLGF